MVVVLAVSGCENKLIWSMAQLVDGRAGQALSGSRAVSRVRKRILRVIKKSIIVALVIFEHARPSSESVPEETLTDL